MSPRTLLARVLLVGALFFAGAATPAGWGLFDSDFDEQKKPWAEIEAQLPPYPKAENLIAFDAGAANSHRFHIDAPSLSVGEDGVVRYTMLVRTAGGATNVSFEGIRCQTKEHKLYAVGRSDGKWTRARDPAWRVIEYKELNRHHGTLYTDFFCEFRSPIRPFPQKEILAALRRDSHKVR